METNLLSPYDLDRCCLFFKKRRRCYLSAATTSKTKIAEIRFEKKVEESADHKTDGENEEAKGIRKFVLVDGVSTIKVR